MIRYKQAETVKICASERTSVPILFEKATRQPFEDMDLDELSHGEKFVLITVYGTSVVGMFCTLVWIFVNCL